MEVVAEVPPESVDGVVEGPDCDGLWCMDPTNTYEVCVDPMTDPENCGACGVTCAVCVDGECPCECDAGRFLLLNAIDTPCLYAEDLLLGCDGGRYTLGADVPWTDLSLDGCDTLDATVVVCGEAIEVHGVRVD